MPTRLGSEDCGSLIFRKPGDRFEGQQSRRLMMPVRIRGRQQRENEVVVLTGQKVIEKRGN